MFFSGHWNTHKPLDVSFRGLYGHADRGVKAGLIVPTAGLQTEHSFPTQLKLF